MSLAKTVLFASRPQVACLSRIQRRSLSSDSDSHDQHHGAEDTSSYPKEGMAILFMYGTPSYSYSRLGFTSAGWTYTIIAALGVVGFYKFAPSPGEENYVTRYISHY